MDYRLYTAEDFVMDEHFQRWVKGGSPEVDAFWEAWLREHPECRPAVREAERILRGLHFRSDALPPERQVRMYNHILGAVQAYEAEKRTARRRPLHRLGTGLPYWVAAAVALLVVAGGGLWAYRYGPYRQVQYATGYGQTQTVALPDGSEVVLNANSVLRHPADWQPGRREVRLEGEAFFKVRKRTHDRTPARFTVHSGSLRVEVLGTEFTVSGREDRTRVVLSEGSVRLAVPAATGTTTIMMKPGELVEYQEDNGAVDHRAVNTEVYHSWKSRRWVLEDVTLRQVADRIEETYGVSVRIADPHLAREPMTGVLPSESLDKLLRVLSATYGIRVHQQENQLILSR
jgi:ferric-dicitrate binding protein FerR (iron transport regulator)